MQEPIWIGSQGDIRHGEEALKALKTQNDTAAWNNNTGILKVSKERWQAAQNFERRGWMEYWRHCSNDRNEEHSQYFNNYNQLPQHLGHLLEVGCGPFTQSSTILTNRTTDHITLQDPLIHYYFDHPNCTYKHHSLLGNPIKPISKMLEEYQPKEEYDTIICINVLEHTMDALKCLDNIYNALKPGGILIMGERAHDDYDPTLSYCIGHPIRICLQSINEYKEKYHIMYELNDTGYFVGRKD